MLVSENNWVCHLIEVWNEWLLKSNWEGVINRNEDNIIIFINCHELFSLVSDETERKLSFAFHLYDMNEDIQYK